MALTAEQKAANREARRERDRAHHQRCREREAARQTGLLTIAATGVHARIKEAQEAEARLWDEKKRADDELVAKIREIERQREATKNAYMERLRTIREALSAAVLERNDAERDLERRLDEQFPDMTGDARRSAAVWGHRRAQSGDALE